MSELRHKTISCQTIGCRLNQYETEKMVADLLPFGFRRVEQGAKADLYIINTCTVTHKADADCRSAIRRVVSANPSARIVVAGCYVDADPDTVGGMEGVDAIIRNAEKSAVSSILPSRFPELFTAEPDRNCSTNISSFHDHNRAWVKVSDGCNQWCTYCIIPTVRGRLRNRPAGDIISEIRSLTAAGYTEVVLTGVNLGHYKNRTHEPQVTNLAHLCRMILDETSIARLRLSSIEPQTYRDELLDLYRMYSNRICRYAHLPLQSGSSRILKLMQRPYDQPTYLRKLSAIKETIENVITGADVIVGFPGETDADFAETCKVVESGLLDYLHVFSYSDRTGTPASRMDTKVDPYLIKERSVRLNRISHSLRAKSYRRQAEKVLPAVVLNRDALGRQTAITDNFLNLKFNDTSCRPRDIFDFRIISATDELLEGEVVTVARIATANMR
jgi:threonylcarbamoyladenosine tRNA methylthiotransferase MtaB